MEILTGCSGYYYREWKGQFYPADLPSTRWLRYYAEHFNTIEINATFYRMPTPKSLAKWFNDTPDDFSFTVKAPQLFTHYRRMKGIAEEQTQFYETVFTALGTKLRCILYQFPASVKYSEAILQAVLDLSPLPVLHAIEFRDVSWWRADVYKALEDAGMVFVNVSIPCLEDVFVPQPQVNYLRFHGRPVLYKSGYGAEGLQPWIDQLAQHPSKVVFAYFNNTWYGEAITDAGLFAVRAGLL